jgi:hypothetical protein
MSRTIRRKAYRTCPEGHSCIWCRPRNKYLKKFLGKTHRIKEINEED